MQAMFVQSDLSPAQSRLRPSWYAPGGGRPHKAASDDTIRGYYTGRVMPSSYCAGKYRLPPSESLIAPVISGLYS